MPTTQKDIAEKLGVTRVLVSRALTNHPSVAAETRARILETAAAMGYSAQSNQAAKALIAKRYNKPIQNGVFAVVMPAIFDGIPLREVPFFSPFFEGMSKEARARGVEICFCPLDGEIPRLITSRSVDGVIAVSDLSLVSMVHEIELPVIVVDKYFPGVRCIVPADREGTNLVTEHLIRLGHRHIAFIGHRPEAGASKERFAGFRSALYEHKLPLLEDLWITDLLHTEMEYGEGAMHSLLGSGAEFTAVVCHHDLLAMGAIRALESRGLRVPEDVSIVGFDDVSPRYNAEPLVTSVAFDREAMGRRAVQLLCEGETSPDLEVVPVELAVRESTSAVKRKG